MKHSTLFIATLLIAQISVAQSIEGIVFDKETGEQLPLANVILLEDSVQIGGMTTSLEGEYFFHIAPGTYNLEAVYIGYLNGQTNEVVVTEGTTKADIEMKADENGIDLSNVYVGPPCIRLIRKDETLSGETPPKTNQGIIQGKVFDEKTKEGLPFANVILLQEGVQIDGTTTDLDGNYIFEKIEQGEYDVEVVYVGYPNSKITGILVEDNTIPLDISMNTSDEFIPIEVNIRTLTIPIIRMDETSTGSTWKGNEIKRFPGF